jgi:hypothetical protein
MTIKINAGTNGLTETVDTSGILELQTNGSTAVIIGVDQNANFTSTGAITVPVGTTAQRPTPVNGMMRYNSNVAVFEVYANNVWAAANVTPAPTNTVAPVISGSAVVGQNLTSTTGTWSGSPSAYFYQWRANSTAIANATANVFTLTSTQTGANITCNVTAFNVAGNSSPATSNTLGPVVLGTTVNYLIVAGGGGGGNLDGGGGGAGGFQTGTVVIPPSNTTTITVGAGGTGSPSSSLDATNGSNSSFGTLTASVGGGFGAGNNLSGGFGGVRFRGAPGGSGGGSGPGSVAAAAGTAGQGNNGGIATGSLDAGGGGGGAGAVGGNGVNNVGGAGGNGTASSISGSSVTYAGGGGAGSLSTGSGGAGGSGGGGAGTNNATTGGAGTANSGGGGGGGGFSGGVGGAGGAGGSGIVIISYPGAQQFGGGVITSAGGNTIHTFSTSGSLVPLTALNSSYLIVAGGGGGGYNGGGGGGAGGLLSGSNVTIDSSSTYIVTVGAGGVGQFGSNGSGGNGANSTFSAVANVAIGGGGGGFLAVNGRAGGSGGGGGGNGGTTTGGTGTSGQGNNGGAGSSSAAGGGGGAGAVGSAGVGVAGGNGGNGVSSSISGTATFYAGGGGGGAFGGGYTDGTGGNGGGGAVGVSGTAGTGGGGGAYSGSATGSGGSGVVIISYPGSTPQMAGGNVTVVSNTVVHTFTSSGFLTPFVNFNNSLRFRRSASAFLNRTPSTTTNQKTFTISFWMKRGLLGASQKPFSFGNTSAEFALAFPSGDTAEFYTYAGSYVWQLLTTQVFRDPAAWYHMVFSVDTTQATASERVKWYVNGSQITVFATANYPSLNYNTYANTSGTVNQIGGLSGASDQYFDGYLTDYIQVDGQALTPNAFGNFNQYGVWAPVRYAGSYGANGFFLPFTNTTSTSTLGNDFSPQGNNWTTNNFSLTAGNTYDSMTDVPTLTSATAANYCVLNPLDNGGLTIQDGNLQAYTATSSWRADRASFGVSSGKWYWEVSVAMAGLVDIGIQKSTATLTDYIGADSSGWGYYSANGQKFNNPTFTAYGATYGNGDVIGVALDLDAGTLTYYKNNSSQGTAFTGLSGTFFPAVSSNATGGSGSLNVNFGQRPFAYTPPSGFVALNTFNL